LADIPLHNHRDRQLYLQPDLIDKFFNQQLPNTTPISRFNVRCTTITPEYFQTHCDQPFMISDIPEHYSWPAKDTWCTPEKFLARHGQVPCKVAELAPLHGMGKPLVIRLPLALYAEYAETCQADFPCYAFERDFNKDNRVLLDDFSVPDYFADDVYALSPELRTSFPQYRYVVVGGNRTGSNMHVDPMYSAAWNTLLCGRKKWLLIPPLPLTATMEENRAHLAAMGLPDEYSKLGRPPLYWWMDSYSKLTDTAQHLGAIEVIQEVGETIYVPQGWWHCVLNQGFTVAATQNFLSRVDAAKIWPRIIQQAPFLAELLTATGVCGYPEMSGH